MKNLDDVRGLNDPIVDQDGRMDELADTGPTVHRVPMYGKLLNRSTWFKMALPNRSAEAGKLAQE
jgi:hypothetical protein